jgi:diguanylate cyclase (GGDEF)-like protein
LTDGTAPPLEKRRVKQHGILLATSGLVLVLVVTLVLRAAGLTLYRMSHWLAALAATLAVQGGLWLAARTGWAERLEWDPHFIYLPMLLASVQLNGYIALVPEGRHLILFVWFVASLFMAGLAGFREMVMLSAVMVGGYLGVLNRLLARPVPMALAFEHTFAAGFFLSSVFAGVVFERLRRERREMKTLRRRLDELAHTDPLTGLANRRQFESILKGETAAVRRHGGECAVAMIDVDFFKHYNDANGHVAGDEALKELADVMRGQVRGSDLLARYGGEEFGLIMRRATKTEALRTAERLRSVVESHDFPDAGRQPGGRLTISAGVAAAPEDGIDFDALVRRSDDALYAAKRNGRNRVESA